jgi:hypothetical protein
MKYKLNSITVKYWAQILIVFSLFLFSDNMPFTVPPHNHAMSAVTALNMMEENLISELALIQVTLEENTQSALKLLKNLRHTLKSDFHKITTKLAKLKRQLKPQDQLTCTSLLEELNNLHHNIERQLALIQVTISEENMHSAHQRLKNMRHAAHFASTIKQLTVFKNKLGKQHNCTQKLRLTSNVPLSPRPSTSTPKKEDPQPSTSAQEDPQPSTSALNDSSFFEDDDINDTILSQISMTSENEDANSSKIDVDNDDTIAKEEEAEETSEINQDKNNNDVQISEEEALQLISSDDTPDENQHSDTV